MDYCDPSGGSEPCCKVESVVSIDERGQMVLPKEIREKANIKAGDKLALVNWGQAGGITCIALIKVEDMNRMVHQMLGPVFKDVFK
jgi:AbrB family looped-hinge helix DNA binding protein